MPATRDVVVIGAGPVGTMAALAHARRGAQVTLLEGHPAAARRFAGEWLHPAAVAHCAEIAGLDLLAAGAAPGRGFVVFDAADADPVILPYRAAAMGASLEHARLVELLRAAAAAETNIDVRQPAQAVALDGTTVHWQDSRRRRHELRTGRVVGADGRNSLVQRALGRGRAPESLSSMGGLLLDDVELPLVDHGHVILGGPGPILAYALGDGRVRMTVDLPPTHAALRRDPERLWAALRPVLPDALAAAVRRALRRGPIQWAGTCYRPRSFYGHGAVALVGDAVGIFHPLTAAGMTMGFADAAALAAARSVRAYGRRRERDSAVPELLSNALYQVFSRPEPTAADLRRAVFAMWRAEPAERARTMAILSGDDRSRRSFATAFAKVGGRAAAAAEDAGALSALLPWLGWPAAAVVPGPLRRTLRPRGGAHNYWRAPQAPAPTAAATAGTAAPTAPDWDALWSALAAVSRTFVRPIALLPEPLDRAVGLGYLLCRIADTVEDHSDLTLRQRNDRFGELLAVLDAGADPRSFAAAMARVPGAADDPELRLAADLPHVLQALGTLPADTQATIRRWVAEMTRGMALYRQRGPEADGLVTLLTIADLDRYCYFVAGTVGHMLTELFVAHVALDEPALATLRAHAEAFAAGLQRTNILKDIAEDRARGFSFVPHTAARAAGLRIAELLEPARRAQAHAAVAPLLNAARADLDRALRYALALPAEPAGLRLFCLIPLWLAAQTLVAARGNDAMFAPDRDVKVPRAAVEATIAALLERVGDDAALTADYAALWAGWPDAAAGDGAATTDAATAPAPQPVRTAPRRAGAQR